jgi:hypothetical protein
MSEEHQISEMSAKWLAEFSIESLKGGRGLIYNQHSESFKWIMGSLLAINSGGAFAVMNNSNITYGGKFWPSVFFVIGILLLIMVAYAAQKLSARVINVIHRQIGFWLCVLEDGVIPPNLNEVEERDRAEAQRFQWIVPAIGWLSALAFVAGVLSLGSALKAKEAVQARTTVPPGCACEAPKNAPKP